jgi:hypothetical protein
VVAPALNGRVGSDYLMLSMYTKFSTMGYSVIKNPARSIYTVPMGSAIVCVHTLELLGFDEYLLNLVPTAVGTSTCSSTYILVGRCLSNMLYPGRWPHAWRPY